MRLLWVLWCFVFVAIGIPAQDSEKKVTNKSELSGTWELLDDESIYTRIGGKSDENYTLQITFSGEEMKIIRTIESDNGKTAYDLLLRISAGNVMSLPYLIRELSRSPLGVGTELSEPIATTQA